MSKSQVALGQVGVGSIRDSIGRRLYNKKNNNIICAIMSLKIYIVEAPLSGAAGLGGHLEGGRQQSIDRVEAVLCSAVGQPMATVWWPKANRQFAVSSRKADSNWSRPKPGWASEWT